MMDLATTIKLQIGHAVPYGEVEESDSVIAMWKEVHALLRDREFVAQENADGHARPYRVTLDASELIALLERVRKASQSFTKHHVAHLKNPATGIDGALSLAISSDGQSVDEKEAHRIATIFLQQVVMAANIVCPGSVQLGDARFVGKGAHLCEAQNFDSRIFHLALRSARDNNWPDLQEVDFAQVWDWLEGCEVSRVNTAIKKINKVLFTLLKLAEQRNEYSARAVLLVMYQMEVLLDCRQLNSQSAVGKRARMILGDIPEKADPIAELLSVRNNLFLDSQPVHRPMPLCRNPENPLWETIGKHGSAVASGTALVIRLLQDLIVHQAYRYSFNETVSRG